MGRGSFWPWGCCARWWPSCCEPFGAARGGAAASGGIAAAIFLGILVALLFPAKREGS